MNIYQGRNDDGSVTDTYSTERNQWPTLCGIWLAAAQPR